MGLLYNFSTTRAFSQSLLLPHPSHTSSAAFAMSKDPHPSSARKRSPEIAFADDTPPPSRPPSRNTHNKRIQRSRKTAERPSWVLAHEESIRLDERVSGAALVDVRWPVGEVEVQPQSMEVGRELSALMRKEGFTVLCFLGQGVETLRSLSQIRSLLANLGSDVFGVSLVEPQEGLSGLPIIHDKNRILTQSLGLLHPLGGGRQALDAIVVLDRESRARMVLPVGWGPRPVAGNCVDETGNRQENVMGRVVRGIEWLHGDTLEERTAAERAADVEVEMGGVLAVV